MFEIGSSLRDTRLRQGLDFVELESRTKIRAKYLRALEDERFDQLPAHTYVKGFLRTYAEALGLDGGPYVDEYNSRYVAGDEETPLRVRRATPAARGRKSDRRQSRVVAVALIAIAVVTALVIGAWKFGEPESPQVRGLAEASSSTSLQPATVLLRAVRGDTFVEVRVGSRAGKPLFSGTLEKGHSQTFTRPRLWLSIASPDNARLLVNGKRASVPAGGELVVSASRVAAVSP
jgi:cytoskeleton protein RodZ